MTERFTGSSSILFWQGRLVLEVRKARKWEHRDDGSAVIGVGGVGGTIEAGETPVESLQREAQEEIGCSLTLRSASRTAIVTPPTTTTQDGVCIDGLCPAMVWTVTDPTYDVGSGVAVFLAEAQADPQPGDLPALLLMEPATFCSLSVEQPLPLTAAIDAGIEVRSQVELPEGACFLPANTMRRLLGLRVDHSDLFEEFIQPR